MWDRKIINKWGIKNIWLQIDEGILGLTGQGADAKKALLLPGRR